jgi:hypothetical protein
VVILREIHTAKIGAYGETYDIGTMQKHLDLRHPRPFDFLPNSSSTALADVLYNAHRGLGSITEFAGW